MKRVFRKIHLWLSVPFGLIITLICFSGAMLVFEKQITELVRGDVYSVSPLQGGALPIDMLVEKARAEVPDGVAITGVTISNKASQAYQINLSKPKRASLVVNQYTGEVLGKNERLPFFSTMFRLHRWLLDTANPSGGIFWGKMIVGVSTLMFVVALISGMAIWLPRTRKVLVNSLKIKRGKRLWHDLHVAGGMYALVLLLVMSLTGLTWSFSWYNDAFYKLFGAEIKQHGNAGRKQSDKEVVTAHWQDVFNRLVAENPEYSQISISDGTASLSFERFGNQRAADRYTFNPENGEITDVNLYVDSKLSENLRGWVYSVHVGAFGGLTTKILWFVAALFGATLPLTGYYLWIKRLRLKRRNPKRL